MNTQCRRVMEYLRKNGSITQREADSQLGVMRLASRISDLRRSGIEITRRMVKAKNRFDEPVTFAEYRLAEGKDEPAE